MIGKRLPSGARSQLSGPVRIPVSTISVWNHGRGVPDWNTGRVLEERERPAAGLMVNGQRSGVMLPFSPQAEPLLPLLRDESPLHLVHSDLLNAAQMTPQL
jgi:hypothetical protein